MTKPVPTSPAGPIPINSLVGAARAAKGAEGRGQAHGRELRPVDPFRINSLRSTAMILYATCDGSGGRYDPADAHLYDWFKTEAEAARHAAKLFAAEGGGCIFRVDLGALDKQKVIALMQETYADTTSIQVVLL